MYTVWGKKYSLIRKHLELQASLNLTAVVLIYIMQGLRLHDSAHKQQSKLNRNNVCSYLALYTQPPPQLTLP
jgi:hypothetical protein